MTKQVTLTLHLQSYQTMAVLFMIQLVLSCHLWKELGLVCMCQKTEPGSSQKRDRKKMVLYPCSLAFIFYQKCKKWGKPALHSNVKSLLLTSGMFLLAGCFRNTNTRKSCFCCSDPKQYKIQEGRSNVHFCSAWAFWFPPSHRMWNLQNFSVEIAIKCSIGPSGEWACKKCSQELI